MFVFRRRKRGGQEMHEVLDVHGGHSGIPVWMTEPRWRELQIASRPRVSRTVLHSLRGLIHGLNSASNVSEQLSLEGGGDERSEATRAAAAQGGLQGAVQSRETAGTGALAGGTSVSFRQACVKGDLGMFFRKCSENDCWQACARRGFEGWIGRHEKNVLNIHFVRDKSIWICYRRMDECA